MIDDLIKIIRCPYCEDGTLELDTQATFQSYLSDSIFTLDDFDTIVDGVVAKHYCFVCYNCDGVVRYTFNEIDKKFRQEISKRILTMIAMKSIDLKKVRDPYSKVFVFCGGCQGFDGEGGCPVPVFEKCEVKKFPNVH